MAGYHVLTVLWKDLLDQFMSQTYLLNVSIELLFLSKTLKRLNGGKIHPQAARETRWEYRNVVIFVYMMLYYPVEWRQITKFIPITECAMESQNNQIDSTI